MTNLDTKNEIYMQVANDLVKAAKGDNEVEMQKAFVDFGNYIQQQVLAEAEKYANVSDVNILASRGIRQLTGEETKYYNKLLDAMKSDSPKQQLENLDIVMPKTTIDEVFTDLETNHPLLSAIDFQFGRGITEWLMNSNPDQLATWSPLCAEIVKELTSGFSKIDVVQNKLSAFMVVCKAMLDLGPVWLDRYVRAVFREALTLGLEDGILNGRGQVNGNPGVHEPIGMRKDLSGNVSQTTGYPDKTPVPFTSFNPTTYGELLATMSKTENDRPRTITSVILVVNPTDYLTKIMPATTVRTVNGSYNNDVFPFPTTIIQSTRLAEGEAIIGLADRYLMVSGSGQSGVIEYSDHYQFLEDNRVYITKFYGHGQPKDNNAFTLLDISNLKPEVLEVRIVDSVNP